MDRETVITHLQIIHTWAEFARERDSQFFTAKHLEDIAKWSDDAIELLKEQEPVIPTWQEGKAFCGSCGLRIPMHRQKKKPYCPSCGRKVKWE